MNLPLVLRPGDTLQIDAGRDGGADLSLVTPDGKRRFTLIDQDSQEARITIRFLGMVEPDELPGGAAFRVAMFECAGSDRK